MTKKATTTSIWPYGPEISTAARDWNDSRSGIKYASCTADERRVIIESYLKQCTPA